MPRETAVTAAQASTNVRGQPSGRSPEFSDQPAPYFGNVDPEPGERDGSRSVVGSEQAEYDMLGADEVVTEGECLPQRLLQRLLRDK